MFFGREDGLRRNQKLGMIRSYFLVVLWLIKQNSVRHHPHSKTPVFRVFDPPLKEEKIDMDLPCLCKFQVVVLDW